jgi:hypothetical protein
LQVPLVGFAVFENDFCGHEQEYTRIHRGRFSADNPLKFSEKIGFCGLHGTILERLAEGFKITRECYQSAGFTPVRLGPGDFPSCRKDMLRPASVTDG